METELGKKRSENMMGNNGEKVVGSVGESKFSNKEKVFPL